MGILLTLSYDGTNYCGWQIQSGVVTVQSALEKALQKVFGEQITVLGASRTDAGVHAMGQRAHFRMDRETKIPMDALPQVINAQLEDDIVVVVAEQVEDSFHPIACTISKTYEYKIYNARYLNPKWRNYACHVSKPLDFAAMQRAASFFVGTYDFRAFCAAGTNARTTVRTVNSLELVENGDMIDLYINGNGFLYNMVRIIAGTLIMVGEGKIAAEQIADIIASRERTAAGRTAPACGLTLLRVNY